MKSQEKKNKFLTVVLVAHLEPNTFAWKTFALSFWEAWLPAPGSRPLYLEGVGWNTPLTTKTMVFTERNEDPKNSWHKWLSGTMILTLLFWMIFSKIVDWMGFSRPSIERWDLRFDTWTKSAFEFSDVAERSPLRTPLIHHMHRSYTTASASIHQTRRATMRQRRFDEVKIGTWLGSVDGSCWWFRNLAKQLRLVG